MTDLARSSDEIDVELFGYLAAVEWHEGMEIIRTAFSDADDAVEAYALGLDTPQQQMWFLWKQRDGELVLIGYSKKTGYKRVRRESWKIEWLWDEVRVKAGALARDER